MYLSRQVKERIGAAVGALAFLVLFGGVGALGIWAIGATVYDGVRARDWTPVQARISHVDTGQVAYIYEWQGKKYAGDRAGTFVLGGTSEVDDWEDRMDRMISAAIAERLSVTAYVNPGNPAESMLNREIRWKLLAVFLPFAVGFTAAGLVTGFMLGRKAIGWRQSGAGVPLLKPKAREALMQWTVGLVWNAVSLPIALIAIPDFWAQGEWFPIALLAIFPCIGILIVWGAVNTTLAMVRDGSPFNARRAT